MHLHELCGSWINHPFWRTKFIIKDEAEARLVVESGITEVVIDIAKGDDVATVVTATPEPAVAEPAAEVAAEPAPPPNAVPALERTSTEVEVQRAMRVVAKSREAVQSMFQEVRMGKAIDAEAAGELVEEISTSVARNSGALISLARLKTADDYTYMHSVAVCALMIALARQLRLEEPLVREAGMAGLLHDLGKAMMPPEVLNKPGKLTDAEFTIMKSHPGEGHRLLVESGTASEVTLDVCLHHHEKVAGGGYPKGLKGDAISLMAKMGAVCDVYDAITSNRPYKAGWDPAESIRRMNEWKGHFDDRVFQAFVKSIGIYPTGSLVRLTSGRLGVVVEQSERSLLMPRVKVFFSSKSKTYVNPELVDLSRPGPEKIVGREDAEMWGLKDIDKFWMS